MFILLFCCILQILSIVWKSDRDVCVRIKISKVRKTRTCVFYLLLIFILTHTSRSLFHTILKICKIQQNNKINKNYSKYYNNKTLYITIIPFIHHYIYSSLIERVRWEREKSELFFELMRMWCQLRNDGMIV